MVLHTPVAHPIEPHINDPGSLLFHHLVQDATGSGIIGHYWGGRLWVACFFEGKAMTDHMISHTVWIDPFSGSASVGHLAGSCEGKLRKEWLSAWLLVSFSKRVPDHWIWMRAVFIVGLACQAAM
eukprot:10517353-Ditylum_brightwellii.AAC.1